MQCPNCKVEYRISKSYLKVVGDQSADTETKVFQVHELTCHNPQCPNKDAVVKENLLYHQ